MLPAARNIAIVSHDGDLHALMVSDELRRAGHCCAVIASDALAGTPGLSWYLDNDAGPALCHDIDGHEVVVRDLHLVWWRRMPRGAAPDYRGRLPDAVQIFSANNIRDSLLGIFLNDFHGVWLDHPEAIQRANNKLTQLRAAAALGLRVPRTLLSQDPDRIRQFAAALDGPMIVKTVAGMLGIPSLTGLVTPEQLEQDGPLKACSALYQELIPGRRHLRVHCFGSEVHTALIESDLLDWRHPLDADITPYALPQGLSHKLLVLLGHFNLQMGIFDLKLTDNDEAIWLELNPQGQFLFIEALGGGNLIGPFVRFVQSAIDRHHSARDSEMRARERISSPTPVTSSVIPTM